MKLCKQNKRKEKEHSEGRKNSNNERKEYTQIFNYNGREKKKWKGRAVVGSGGRWGNNKRIKWKVHRNKVEDKKKVGQS